MQILKAGQEKSKKYDLDVQDEKKILQQEEEWPDIQNMIRNGQCMAREQTSSPMQRDLI